MLSRDKPSIEYCVVLDESLSCKIWLRRDDALLRGFLSDGKSKIENKIMSFKFKAVFIDIYKCPKNSRLSVKLVLWDLNGSITFCGNRFVFLVLADPLPPFVFRINFFLSLE